MMQLCRVAAYLNIQLHRSVNSRLRRLSPPGELGRWAASASRYRVGRFTAEVDEARAARLHSWSDFRPIVLALKVVVSVDTFWWEAYRDANLKGCNRASFTLKVPSPLYDAFFNSPNGYRGQYARASGLEKLRIACLWTSWRISARWTIRPSLDATPDRIRMSLKGTDAKVWIVEDEVEDQLAADHPAIWYAPWERNTLDGQGLRAPGQPARSERCLARFRGERKA